MKRCKKLSEPPSFENFRKARPSATWKELRNDTQDGGPKAYKEAKMTLVLGQRGLCAYCEILLTESLSPQDIQEKAAEQRIEHFHSKNDSSTATNWSLKWENLWAVCNGGSREVFADNLVDSRKFLPPLPENLSCDAFKDRQIQIGQLPKSPEGFILSPHQIPPFPPLFKFSPDGLPEPDEKACSATTIPGNRLLDTQSLVASTIMHLNLKCERLNRARRIAKAQLEKQIAKARLTPRSSPQETLLNLARRLLSLKKDSPWPAFFSLILCRLGEPAELRLREMSYEG